MWEGVEDRTKTAIYWPPLLWPSALCLSRSHDAKPEAQGPTLLAFSTASYHQLVWSPNSIGGPEGPFGRVWLSLLHLVSNSSDLQPVCLPVHTEFYRPLNRPLNLWNGMFDRHQAEITVMQFIGHSLPVHQSMSVSWAFTLSHFVNQIRLRDFFRLLAIGMCRFLPVHHFGMACLARSKVNIQHYSFPWIAPLYLWYVPFTVEW